MKVNNLIRRNSDQRTEDTQNPIIYQLKMIKFESQGSKKT